MSHRSARRQNLAPPPEPNPPPSGGANHHQRPTATIFTPSHSHYPSPNPDLLQPSKPSFLVKPFSTLNLGHKKKSQTKRIDTLLKSKSMTASAILDSSEEKPQKEKPQKFSSELERWKLHSLLKKNNERKCVVEDVEIQKPRELLPVEDVKESVCVSLGGRRRSLCAASIIDLGDFFSINGAKMVSADMPPFMQIHAVGSARKAFDSMEKFTSKSLALSLKKEFDGVYGPAWHCIVGTSFGSFVTHSVGGFLYFSVDKKLYILLFKTAVQKAD